MTVLITLIVAGVDAGPFNLYSDLDGYTTPFEVGISKNTLLGGYVSIVVPDGTGTIRVLSQGVCVNFIELIVVYPNTTTTTTIALTTTTTTDVPTTTTTTIAPSTTTTTTVACFLPHAFFFPLIYATNTVSDFRLNLTNAYIAQACLNATSCTALDVFGGYWDNSLVELSDTAYSANDNCEDIVNATGYFILEDSFNTLVEMLNGVIISFPPPII